MKNLQNRGRPRDQNKTLNIIAAARGLLLSKGPEVTLDEIARAAGVAKVTLYAKFGDKSGLIKTVIRHEADLTITNDEINELLDKDPLVALQEFGFQFLTFLNSRDLIKWDRLIASLETQESELPKTFFNLGPGRGQKVLEMLIKIFVERQQLTACDPVTAADVLTGLWLGFINLEVKLGVRPPLSSEQISVRVEEGISMFMKIFKSPSIVKQE